MFRPIHILPQFSIKKRKKYQERWESNSGRRERHEIVEKIKQGAGEDFLQWDFEQGVYSVIEDYHDLKGITLWQLEINFPCDDNFEGINFSYAQGWHSKFSNATFPSTYCEFGRFYNFEFNQCLFSFSNWYGVTFEKVKFIKCDFVEHDGFNNCRFIDCEFIDCFFSESIFIDCSFNVQTTFSKVRQRPTSNFNVVFKDDLTPELYKGIKDSYLAGEVFEQYRKYLFLQRHSETKYLKRGLVKARGYINEMFVGYGVRPQNTLLVAMLVILSFCLLLTLQSIGINTALKMSISAFVGFSNMSDEVGSSSLLLVESVIGVFLIALFITVLANVWFSEK